MKGFLQRKTRKHTGFTSFKGFIFFPPLPFSLLFFLFLSLASSLTGNFSIFLYGRNKSVEYISRHWCAQLRKQILAVLYSLFNFVSKISKVPLYVSIVCRNVQVSPLLLLRLPFPSPSSSLLDATIVDETF